MPGKNPVIVRGKRQCVLTRDSDAFQLIVVRDDFWKETIEKDYTLMFDLSPSAACVWEILKDCPSEQELLLKVSEKTGLPETSIKSKINAFLKILDSQGLISYGPDSESERFSPYKTLPGSEPIQFDDAAFNIEDLNIAPVNITQDVFCFGESDPYYGWAQPTPTALLEKPDVHCEGCLTCS